MIRLLCAGAVAGLLLAAPLEAQSGRPGSFGITPYAGYMRFGTLVDGPLGTRVRGAGSPVYGAEATLGITPDWRWSATWPTPARTSRSACL